MRVACGRLWQESNDLSTVPTTADDWRANGVLRGAEIEALAGQQAAELGGFVDSLLARTRPAPCDAHSNS